MTDLREDEIRWTLEPAPESADACSLDEMLVDAVLESQSYRLLAQRALQAIHDLTVACDRCREQKQHIDDEYRSLRERVMRSGVGP